MGRERSIVSRALSALVAGVLVTAASADAQAFCRTTTCDPNNPADHCRIDEKGCTRSGAPLTWPSLPIAYRFYAKVSQKIDHDVAREAVRSAFQSWSEVVCENGHRTSLRFEEQQDIVGSKPGNPHMAGAQHFGIYFRDDTWTAKDADSTLALTTQSFGKISGDLDVSDIEINTTTEAYATGDTSKGIDLQAVVTHEVGHYIGLAHSLESDSIMVARYCDSGERCSGDKADARKLSEDDRAAVCALYPAAGISGVTPADPNEGGCALGGTGHATSGRSSAASWLPLGAAAFVVAALRRRRRRRRRSV